MMMKVLLQLTTKLNNSLQNPGLKIYTAVHENAKERNLSLILRDKRVGTWCMVTYHVPLSFTMSYANHVLALGALVPFFDLLPILDFRACLNLLSVVEVLCFNFFRCFASLRCFTRLNFSASIREEIYPYCRDQSKVTSCLVSFVKVKL